MKKYCKQNCWQIVETYVDEARSATTDKRPNFQRMIEDSSKGVFDIVLVHKLDRFSRNRYVIDDGEHLTMLLAKEY